MSKTIFSTRPGQRETLAELRPGERLINGRIYYSAAWLSTAAPFEPEAVTATRPAARDRTGYPRPG
jgi:hypothetical protein